MLLQIAVAMKAMPWYCCLPTLSEYMIQRGWTQCFSAISDVGWALYVVYLSIYLVICEFGIYWMHRELHDIKPLYKYLHATHHIYNKQNTLSPFAGTLCYLAALLSDIRLMNDFSNHNVFSECKWANHVRRNFSFISNPSLGCTRNHVIRISSI